MMVQPLPRVLRFLTVTVLLVLCAVVVSQLFCQVSLQKAIDRTAHDLDITRQRLALQQQEYQQAQAELPVVLAELEAALPLSEEAYAQEQTLRAQRKALRAENAALAKEIELLQSALTEDSETFSAADAILRLQTALENLAALREALQ